MRLVLLNFLQTPIPFLILTHKLHHSLPRVTFCRSREKSIQIRRRRVFAKEQQSFRMELFRGRAACPVLHFSLAFSHPIPIVLAITRVVRVHCLPIESNRTSLSFLFHPSFRSGAEFLTSLCVGVEEAFPNKGHLFKSISKQV